MKKVISGPLNIYLDPEIVRVIPVYIFKNYTYKPEFSPLEIGHTHNFFVLAWALI